MKPYLFRKYPVRRRHPEVMDKLEVAIVAKGPARPPEWADFAPGQAHPANTPEYADFYETLGHTPVFLEVWQGKAKVAQWLVCRRRRRFNPLAALYADSGPHVGPTALDRSDDVFVACFDRLRRSFHLREFVLLKHALVRGVSEAALRRSGFGKVVELRSYVSPVRGDDEMLAAFHSSHRNDTRKALREGLRYTDELSAGEYNALAAQMEHHRLRGNRANGRRGDRARPGPIRPPFLSGVFTGGQLSAASVVLHAGACAFYLHGASRRDKARGATTYLHYENMRRLRALGSRSTTSGAQGSQARRTRRPFLSPPSRSDSAGCRSAASAAATGARRGEAHDGGGRPGGRGRGDRGHQRRGDRGPDAVRGGARSAAGRVRAAPPGRCRAHRDTGETLASLVGRSPARLEEMARGLGPGGSLWVAALDRAPASLHCALTGLRFTGNAPVAGPVATFAAKRRLVALTLDYGPGTRSRRAGQSMGARRVEPTRRFATVATMAAARVTFFVELGEYFYLRQFEPAVAARMEDQWRELVRGGHGVQLHLRPDWLPELGARREAGRWRWDAQLVHANDYPGTWASCSRDAAARSRTCSLPRIPRTR